MKTTKLAAWFFIAMGVIPCIAQEEYTTSDGSGTFRKVWEVTMNDQAPDDHTSNNEAAEFSPDGTLLAVACGDAVVRVVSIPQGEIIKEFDLYDGVCDPSRKDCEVEVVYWTPDSKYIVAAGNDILPALVIDYETGEIVKTLVQASDQDALTISKNGEYMAVAADDDVVMYRTSDWSLIKRLTPTNDGDLNSFDFSPDDRYLATGGNQGHVGLLSVPDFTVEKDLHEGGGYVKSVRFSPDGRYLVRTSHQDYFQLWNVANGEMVRQVAQPEYVEAVAIHPNGEFMVVGGKDLHYEIGDYPMKVYSFPDLDHLLDIPNDGENVEYLDITADGKYLAQPSTTGHVILWEMIFENTEDTSQTALSDFVMEAEQCGYTVCGVLEDGKRPAMNIFNIHGRKVNSFVLENGRVVWDGRAFGGRPAIPLVYLVRFQTGRQRETGKFYWR